MGQIVSSAAKPKRCNANQLSQVPTPAAGEHILVSSDNSMNAAGQGNFDCYIVGDGTTAATSLELHNISEDKLELEVETDTSMLRYYWIDDNGVWKTGTNNICQLIPIEAGMTYIISTYSNKKTQYAFLSNSEITLKSSPSWATGWSSKQIIAANTQEEVVAPSDATYLYTLYWESNNEWRTPRKIEKVIDFRNVVSNITELQTDVDNIKYIETEIDNSYFLGGYAFDSNGLSHNSARCMALIEDLDTTSYFYIENTSSSNTYYNFIFMNVNATGDIEISKLDSFVYADINSNGNIIKNYYGKNTQIIPIPSGAKCLVIWFGAVFFNGYTLKQYKEITTSIELLNESERTPSILPFSYIGEPFLKNRFTIHNVMYGRPAQSMAFYNNFLFVFEDKMKYVYVYSMNTKGLVYTASLTEDSTIHANNATFSTEFYDVGDTYPIVYIGAVKVTNYNVYGYRIIENNGTFTFTLVHTITQTIADAIGWMPVIDTDNNVLYMMGNDIIAAYDMPTYANSNNGVTNLDDITPNYTFQTNSTGYGVQDACYYNGRIYQNFGTSSPNLYTRAIDLNQRKDVSILYYTNTGINQELEGIDVYNGDIYVNSNGDIFKLVFKLSE